MQVGWGMQRFDLCECASVACVSASADAKTNPTRRRPSHDVLSGLRRGEIIEAAIGLFGRKGFSATRTEEIARAAKIAKGTVYLYFENKEAIYTAAVTHALRALHDEIRQHSGGTAGFYERLHAAIRVRLEFWPEHEAIYRLLLTVGREPRLRLETHRMVREAQQGFVALFREGVEADALPSGDYEPLAWATLDMIRGAAERRMDNQTTTTPEEDATCILSFVRSQIRSLAEAQAARV